MNRLIKLVQWLKKDFRKASVDDIKNLVRKIEQNKRYKGWTKEGYKVTIKNFYRWLEGNGEEYPEK